MNYTFRSTGRNQLQSNFGVKTKSRLLEVTLSPEIVTHILLASELFASVKLKSFLKKLHFSKIKFEFKFYMKRRKVVRHNNFKDAFLGLRQTLATESPLNMTKNTFYFTSKDLFVLKIFKLLS